jgi:hypothetical protein
MHNSDAKGARYCIDLACIAGYPRLGTWKEPKITESGSKAVHVTGTKQKLLEMHDSAPELGAFDWMWVVLPAVACAMVRFVPYVIVDGVACAVVRFVPYVIVDGVACAVVRFVPPFFYCVYAHTESMDCVCAHGIDVFL